MDNWANSDTSHKACASLLLISNHSCVCFYPRDRYFLWSERCCLTSKHSSLFFTAVLQREREREKERGQHDESELTLPCSCLTCSSFWATENTRFTLLSFYDVTEGTEGLSIRGEVCKHVGSCWVHSGRAQAMFFFFFTDRAHLASLLLLCPYTCRAHMAIVWNTDCIINIIHHLHNAYTHALAYRWPCRASGRIWRVVTKSSQCFGKSCILDHPCIWWWSWLAVSSWMRL